MSDHRPAVSARGVLDGDPAALASLCDLRGPSVIAYCEAVCGAAVALDAAAAAFAAFRSTAVHATRPLALNPDALLLTKTREAAAERAPDPAAAGSRRDDPLCPLVPLLLASAAQGALSPADRHRLRRHLARCAVCRAAQNAQGEGERAYIHPPVRTLTPIARQAIIAALRNAAPAGGSLPATLPPATSAATAVSPAGVPDPASSSPPARVPAGVPAPPAAPRVAAAVPEKRAASRPTGQVEAPTGVIPVERIAAALGYEDPPAEESWPAEAEPDPQEPPAPPRGRAALGRLPFRVLDALPAARVVAPAAILLAALLVILAIAGVLGSGSPHPASPGSNSTTPGGLGGAATLPAPSYNSPAAHRARLRAAKRRRAARARARAAARAGGGVTKTGAAGRPTPASTGPTPPTVSVGRPAARARTAGLALPPPTGRDRRARPGALAGGLI